MCPFFLTVQTSFLVGCLWAFIILPIHRRSQKSSGGTQPRWLPFAYRCGLLHSLAHPVLVYSPTWSSSSLWTMLTLPSLPKALSPWLSRSLLCISYINPTPSCLTVRLNLSYSCSANHFKSLLLSFTHMTSLSTLWNWLFAAFIHT